MSKDEREEKRERSGTTMRSVEEGKRALWNERTASKRSSNEYGGVNNMVGGSDSCKIQGM